jgi:hypothetical protein
VPYGSKPRREIEARPTRLQNLHDKLKLFEQAERYLPHRVNIGKQSPERLRELPKLWFNSSLQLANELPPFGEFIGEREFITLLAVANIFQNVRLIESFWDGMKPVLDQYNCAVVGRRARKNTEEMKQAYVCYHESMVESQRVTSCMPSSDLISEAPGRMTMRSLRPADYQFF